MKLLILAAALASASTLHAEGPREVKLTPACETKLKEEYLQKEAAYLKEAGEVLAGPLKATVGLSYWPARAEINLSVRVEEEVDGRTVSWAAKVLKVDALACQNIVLERRTGSACRYSRGEGPDSLTEIRGLTYREGRTIKPKSQISLIEEEQIRQWLDSEQKGLAVSDLIAGTDDRSLSTGLLTLPDGVQLDYYGAYGGDNPYGIFYVKGTTEVAGDNGDGFVCLKYAH